MEIRKLIKLSRRRKAKSCLLLCYIRRENVSVTYVILGQNELLCKDCDMSHCAQWSPSGKWGQWNSSSPQQPERSLSFLDERRCQRMSKTSGRKGTVLKILSIRFGTVSKLFYHSDILDLESMPLITVPIEKETLEKFL